MKRELKITLTPTEVQKHLVDVVAKKQKLPDGNYTCSCTTTGSGEIVLVFALPDEER